MKNKQLFGLITFLSISLLSACGGGSSSGNTLTNGESGSNQPHRVDSNHSSNVLSRRSAPSAPVISTTADTLTISYTAPSGQLLGEHYQFFLNTDNNENTGFRFDGEAWDKAGTDYIVEDGHLFKSTSNDSNWNWNENVGAVVYHNDGATVSVTIKQSLLTNLQPLIKVGLMERDSQWNVKAIYPNSSIMQAYHLDITPPNVDTVAPVMHLNGSSNITISEDNLYRFFIDPGATAIDNVDGDISHKITVDSNLYLTGITDHRIVYSVKDQAGNSSSITRNVTIVDELPDSIFIDGDKNDWRNINPVSEDANGIIKTTFRHGKLFILIDAIHIDKNTQIFLDTDNNSATGLRLNDTLWNEGGADYMIENNHLDKANGNSANWSWHYNIGAIEAAINNDVAEIAIPARLLRNLKNKIKIGFVNRDSNWNITSVMPKNKLAIAPFSRTHGVSGIISIGNKSYGISANKKAILVDDGVAISTVFTSEYPILDNLYVIRNRLYFMVRKSGPNGIHGSGFGSTTGAFQSYDLRTNQLQTIMEKGSRTTIQIVQQMNDFLVYSYHYSSRGSWGTYFVKIDKNHQEIDLIHTGHGTSFDIISVDNDNNSIHTKVRKIVNRQPVIIKKKITERVGAGLEDE
jgi:hypothetical protein